MGDGVVPRPRPRVCVGATTRVVTGCGHLYVTVNRDGSAGPVEIFVKMGKAGGCAASQNEAIGRLVSLALRAGVAPAAIVKQLAGIRCPSPGLSQGIEVCSCADGVARVLRGEGDAGDQRLG